MEFPLPGGMGPYATVDIVFSLSHYFSCAVVLTKTSNKAALLQLRLASNTTHVYGSVSAEFTGSLVEKDLVPVPFSTGLNSWGFITFPAGMVGFFNYQEHFRIFSNQDVSFASLGSLQISGVAVANVCLGRMHKLRCARNGNQKNGLAPFWPRPGASKICSNPGAV